MKNKNYEMHETFLVEFTKYVCHMHLSNVLLRRKCILS